MSVGVPGLAEEYCHILDDNRSLPVGTYHTLPSNQATAIRLTPPRGLLDR